MLSVLNPDWLLNIFYTDLSSFQLKPNQLFEVVSSSRFDICLENGDVEEAN